MKLGNINKFGGDLSKVVSKLGDTVQVLKSSFMPFQSHAPAPPWWLLRCCEHRPLTCPAVPAQERTRTLQSHLEETFEVRGEKVSSSCFHDP